MKKFILLLLASFFAISCEDVIDVELENTTPRLVIDASLDNVWDGSQFVREGRVKLSLTTPFFNEEDSFVNNATVSITNINENISENLVNTRDGVYEFPTDSNFEIIEENSYKLTIIYRGEIYEATETLQKSAPIENLEQIKNPNDFSPNDIALNVTYIERPERGNHYIFDLDDTNFIAVNDEFVIDNAPFTFTFFYDEDVERDIRVKIIGSSKRYNTFFDAIQELSGVDDAGPFASVPFKAKGNIVNKSNKDNFPFGYFRVSEVFFDDITLVDNESIP